MNVGQYRGAVAMQVTARRMDSIATNLANLSVNGYKAFEDASASYEVEGRHGKLWGQTTDRRIDWSQGNLKRTGRELDLALFGEGFFAVESPDGERYTRDGEFQLTPEGNLITTQGWPVAWDVRDGLIDPTGSALTVDGDGNVRQGIVDIGRLRLVDFEDKQRMVPSERGTWAAPSGLGEATSTASVNQGALEESNTTAVDQMVSMIQTQRHFDVMARTVAAIKEIEERLTRSR